jgi:hypothetical protein
VPAGDPGPWRKAARDYFFAKLSTRYLEPIDAIRQSGKNEGEGFSNVAIQCSLIEFF